MSLLIFQVSGLALANANKRSLEERIRNLELENQQQNSRFYGSQEGNTEGGSSKGGLRWSSRRQTWSPNDVWFMFLIFLQNKKKCSLDKLVLISVLALCPWNCFRSHGNFKWDKFRIHLMRSCSSTNLNLSWLVLMEFALIWMRQSWMPLV